MKTSDSESGQGFRLLIPGAVVVLMAVLGFKDLYSRFDSKRPPRPAATYPLTSPDELHAIRARLWEDPLEVVYGSSKSLPSQKTSSTSGQTEDTAQEPESSADDFEKSAFLLRNIVRTHCDQQTNEDGEVQASRPFIVMPVLLPGSPDADASEARIRINYAVLAGLDACGYRFAYTDRLTYIDVPTDIWFEGVETSKSVSIKVPVKLCKVDQLAANAASRPDLLLLWIDEGQLGSSPLYSLTQMLAKVFGSFEPLPVEAAPEENASASTGPAPTTDAAQTDSVLLATSKHPTEEAATGCGEEEICFENISFHVLGPSNSDDLLKFAEDLKSLCDFYTNQKTKEQSINKSSAAPVPEAISASHTAREVPSCGASQLEWNTGLRQITDRLRIYSYRATFGPKELGASQADVINFLTGSTPASLDSKDKPRPELARMIGSDRQLVDAILEELKLRNALPIQSGDKRHVVIFAERDTLYGRGLRNLFQMRSSSLDNPASGIPEENLHLFTYLRGIDGYESLAGVASKTDATSGRPGANRSTDALGRDVLRGTSQYDYLRRIVDDLHRLSAQLRFNGQGRITAVGIMGTDIYDKLLVLRAVRPAFPQACYFTTDLDASFCDVTEYDTARNLLVASHFGLQLHPELQRGVPPFRDSYQTACFLSVLHAAGDRRTAKLLPPTPVIDPWQLSDESLETDGRAPLRPLIFEIARNGPYQLTVTDGPVGADAWLEKTRDRNQRLQSISALIHPTSPRQDSTGQFFVRAAWATGGLFLLCLFMNAYVERMRSVGRDLFQMLVNLFLPNSQVGQRLTSSVAWICLLIVLAAAISVIVDLERPNGEPFEFLEGISIWPTVLLRLVAVGFAIFFIFNAVRKMNFEAARLHQLLHIRNDDDDDDDHPHASSTWWHNFGKAWGRMLRPITSKDRLKRDVTDILNDYSDDVRPSAVFARVLPLVIMCFSAAYALFGWNQLAALPFRGNIAWFWETSTNFLTLALIVFLLFLIIDLFHVGRRLIKALVRARQESWTPRMLGLTSTNTESQLFLARIRLINEIVATHSQTLSGLVLYPSIVIFLSILARLNVFDNWNLPWTLMVIILVGVAGALYANFSLRNRARVEHERLIRQTKQELYTVRQMKRADEIDLYEQTIHDLQQERRGALRPLAEDPLIQAITLPFGGVGGVVLFEQFFNYYS